MSINPVQNPNTASPMPEASEPLASVRLSPASHSAPNLGTVSKRESHMVQDQPVPEEIAKDEVQVQRDSQAGGAIVIRYLDAHGNVVLQVPSSQVLELARSIRQDLESATKAVSLVAAEASSTVRKEHP